MTTLQHTKDNTLIQTFRKVLLKEMNTYYVRIMCKDLDRTSLYKQCIAMFPEFLKIIWTSFHNALVLPIIILYRRKALESEREKEKKCTELSQKYSFVTFP